MIFTTHLRTKKMKGYRQKNPQDWDFVDCKLKDWYQKEEVSISIRSNSSGKENVEPQSILKSKQTLNDPKWQRHLWQMHVFHLLAGISSFEEGIDRLCESSGYRQRVLSPHCERTGPSGAAWPQRKHTHTEIKRKHWIHTEEVCFLERTNKNIWFPIPKTLR